MNLIKKIEKREMFANYDRYYFDKIDNPQDVYSVINMLMENGYEPIGFQIGYDNDHTSYEEPKNYEDYQSFVADLPNEYLAVDTVSVFYNNDGYTGCATIYLANNSLLIPVPVKKNEETMSR